MKQFKLNFKSIVQNKARWLLTIIAILTLGVGQMWATSGTITVYFKNTVGWTNVYVYFYNNSYWSDTQGSGSSTGSDRFESGPNTMTWDNTLKLWKYTYTGTYSGYVVFTKDSQSNYGNFWNTEAVYRGDFSTSTPIFIPSSDGNTENLNSTKYYKEGEWVSTTKRTVYFINNDSWTTPKAYVWNSYSEHVAWSGETMSSTGKTYNGKNIYSYTTQYDFANIKFSDNGSNETETQTLGSTNAGKMYDNGTWRAYTYDVAVTLDKTTGSASGSANVYYNVSTSFESSTAPTGVTGYEPEGYYVTYNAGTGEFTNKVATSAGALQKSTPYTNSSSVWTSSSDRTLYTKWKPKTYSITLSRNGGSPDRSTTATYNSSTLVAWTAPTRTGYTLTGYWTNSSGGTKIINANGTLVSGVAGWTDGSGNWTKDAASTVTLHAQWSENKTAITITTDGHGTITKPSPNNSPYSLGVTTTQAINATANTGYSWNKWTTSGNAELGTTATTASNIAKGNGTAGGTGTVTATFTAKTYDVILDVNGGSGDNQTVVATYDAAMPGTVKTAGTAIAARTKTGYNFDGYTANDDGTGTKYYTSALASNHIWDIDNNEQHIYAKWNPKSCDITFNFDESDDGYGSKTGATASTTATYDADMTSVTPPTAKNGYAFMGYYTAADGEGTQYYDGSGNGVTTWAENTESETTLYAYYKKAEITTLTLAESVVGTASTDSITVTPTISPTPTGTTKVCWEIQYSNGTALSPQPAGRVVSGNTYRFKAPSASATYIIQAVLETGSTCGSGTELSTRTTTFQVAGLHDVTVLYKDASGNTIKASQVIEGVKPLEWTTDGDITAPTITGYTFARWDAGDGVSIKNGELDPVTTSTNSSIQIKANYDGTLTAVYNKKRLIFFNNTLGWSSVYVYFYSNDKYWGYGSDDGKGTGSNPDWTKDATTPFIKSGAMTQIGESNIWYYDCEANSISSSVIDVAFTELHQEKYNYFATTETAVNKVVRRGDYDATKLPMFVPLTGVDPVKMNDNKAEYYNEGYWMNYPENTGYVLKIYDNTTWGSGDPIQSIPFEYNADKNMPMSVTVGLSGNTTYGFELHRNDGKVFGNAGTMKNGVSGDEGQTVWEFKRIDNRCGIKTSVAGDYVFKLNFGLDAVKPTPGYNYLIGVHYPVAENDYRVLYNDRVAWSHAAAHDAAWKMVSRTIHKEAGKKDTVSFYVSKADGASASMKFQYASEIDGEGAVTWSDVTGGAISLTDIEESGVYNFCLTQTESGISVEAIKPYTGNYYIRTDCAGATRWESYRTLDHLMTYSDYAESSSGYSHYYCHWVTTDKNIKFCIANDYSLSVSDTLDGDSYTHYDEGKSANTGWLDADANIRFMWNQSSNKISRAYIGGSSRITDRFLVLDGDSKMYNENGVALTGDNRDHRTENHGDGDRTYYVGEDGNEVILNDDQNFVYERTIKVNATAKAKVTALYNGNVQYFKGGSGSTSADSVLLLGGTYNAEKKYKMRIVYDFKTNRLVTAYEPEGTVDEAIEIDADIMIVREHQEAGEQLEFSGSGELKEVHTVYGVMRFNRWTLNNKEKTGGHSIVGDPKSSYERGLYWISFPFDVNLSDVFGFGTYGVDWIIEYYDGAARAEKGYWKDSEGFWEFVMPYERAGYVLEAGKGYVLALDLDRMKDDNTEFWTNNIEQVELFFPSATYVKDIKETNVKTSADPHLYSAAAHPGHMDDRTYKDSHWNMIGVPSYANYGDEITSDGSTVISWATPTNADLPYLYEWSPVDNSYVVQTGTTYSFKSMHAYMVQYHGDMHWALASATPVVTPSPIVARRTYAEKAQNVEMRMELIQNEKMVDQTFVKLSNDEDVSADFQFDEDLCKEFNANKANIYTIVENYIPTAGNTMPMSDQTTMVPVGVKIAADGDYTFAIPEGTNGVGVTLIDNETGIRTSLGALDYTINLSAGTYDERFVLEISPIKPIITGIDQLQMTNDQSPIKKILIDGLLYIVKDGKMFDARGAVVK